MLGVMMDDVMIATFYWLLLNIWHADHVTFKLYSYVTQRELMRLFEGDTRTDSLNSKYCSISKEHFDTKMIFISYSYQKL